MNYCFMPPSSNAIKSCVNHNGYTLYLILIILSITAILFSVTIGELRAAHVFAKREIQRSQARLLAESGIVRTEYFLNGGDGRSIDWETPGYRETVDDFGSIDIVVERFGLFSRVRSTGKRLVTDYTAASLFGRTVPEQLSATLTLTGHVGGLILHKGSTVEGNITLHHGFVYARKKGNPLPDYTRRLTFKEMPPLPFDTLRIPELFDAMARSRTTALENSRAATGSLTLDGGNDPLLKSKPLIIDGDCRIRTKQCNGALLMVSGTCTIEPQAVVTSTACYAKKMVINGGTTGGSLFFAEETVRITAGSHNSQFLSGDSIVIVNQPRFGAATILASLRQKVKKDSLFIIGGGIYSDDNITLQGTLLCCTAPDVNRTAMSPSIVLGKGTQVKGNIITDGDCSINNCDIEGRLWANAIVAKDEDREYTNYLIKSTITTDREQVVFPLLGDAPMRIVLAGER